jgi:hypothetical protein
MQQLVAIEFEGWHKDERFSRSGMPDAAAIKEEIHVITLLVEVANGFLIRRPK